MESRLPIMAKKVWSLVRVMFFMLKKGIAKTKFILDLNTMMNRGKIAGKGLHNLMFHHHHNWVSSALHRHPHHLSFTAPPPGEYEFSCSDTPPYPLSLFSTHKKHQNKLHRIVNAKPPPAVVDNCDDINVDFELSKALDILIANSTMSPTIPPGFRNTLMVEHLRIKDSPLAALSRGDEDGQVDEAAERFIRRFYSDRKREN
ncbi:hypothetical protein L6452_33448 [Arctium lappa]|uniref:Uncharacterized protein n=1 Tax=Arctium lappa TaxID=4217 RepID=A0ACB8YFD5_ARCLA|nr:hypothetical protein L6452_33448 [Arctium lappa]